MRSSKQFFLFFISTFVLWLRLTTGHQITDIWRKIILSFQWDLCYYQKCQIFRTFSYLNVDNTLIAFMFDVYSIFQLTNSSPDPHIPENVCINLHSCCLYLLGFRWCLSYYMQSLDHSQQAAQRVCNNMYNSVSFFLKLCVKLKNEIPKMFVSPFTNEINIY